MHLARPFVNHTALLLPSVRKAAETLARAGFEIGKEEEWDGEGTREIYVGRGAANALLLMEPVREGAYQRAMQKRGPGLHHIAIDVPQLDEFIASTAINGWVLHPASSETMKKSRTAYLSRRGIPTLIEVQEAPQTAEAPTFVERVSLPFDHTESQHLSGVGLSETLYPGDSELTITLQKLSFSLSQLC